MSLRENIDALTRIVRVWEIFIVNNIVVTLYMIRHIERGEDGRPFLMPWSDTRPGTVSTAFWTITTNRTD